MDIEIRQATELDAPEIVKFLVASLGESRLPKSEEIWKFKHLENPFGESIVLLALSDGEIVGIRAFMKWEWMIGRKLLKACRAVDTGTLPEHQGKGIFTSLNRRVVEIAKSKGQDFVFNTPNSKSLPGNLKLGWSTIDKIRLSIFPTNPFNSTHSTGEQLYTVNHRASQSQIRNLTMAYNEHNVREGNLFTPKSDLYLRWRYENNPLQEYEVLADKNYYLAAYLKKHRMFKELRVTEHIYLDREGLKQIKKAVKGLSAKFGANVISFSPKTKYSSIRLSGKFGPILTFRELNLNAEEQEYLLNLENWNYSLGDLELF